MTENKVMPHRILSCKSVCRVNTTNWSDDAAFSTRYIDQMGLINADALGKEDFNKLFRSVLSDHKRVNWVLGDLLLQSTRWGNGKSSRVKYAEAKQALGCSDSTLRNIVLTCHKIPKEKRRAELSFTHHQETVKLKCSMAQREELLQKAIDEKMLCKDFRIYCRECIRHESLVKSDLCDSFPLNDPAFALWQAQKESNLSEVYDFLAKINELKEHPIWQKAERLTEEEKEKIQKSLDQLVVTFREKLSSPHKILR